jgi:hypothetical protein
MNNMKEVKDVLPAFQSTGFFTPTMAALRVQYTTYLEHTY